MKKLLMFLACAFSAIEIYAQTSEAEADAIIHLLGIQKKEAIAKLVSASGKDSIAFWNLYDEYQKKNAVEAKNRILLYEKTAASYGILNSAVADSLARKYFENRMKQEKNLEEYYSKIKTATNAVTAFEFYQAEVYILTMIRAQIMQQIPTYGEFMVATKKK
jgi:hypothetical protein